ncbi:hypothetical protein SFUMM280S_00483 [Streptomyces fumanus]
MKRFLDTGVSLQNIRSAVRHLRESGFRDLERMTLMSDGATVYECTSPDEVHALLQGGQGIFGIAVGVVWRDVENALSQLHGERIDTGETLVGPTRPTNWPGGATGRSEPGPPRHRRPGGALSVA